MFLDLVLEASLEAVEISVTQPLRRAFHAARDLVRHLSDFAVGWNRGAAIGRRARERCAAGLRPVAKASGAGLECIGQSVLRRVRALANRGADARPFVTGRTEHS